MKNRICGFEVAVEPAQVNLELVVTAANEGKSLWIVTVNLEMISLVSADPNYLALLSSADLCFADGMPLVWVSHLNGGPNIAGRTTGVDLVRQILAHPRRPRIGILGGDDPITAVQCLEVPPVEYVDAGLIQADEGWLNRTARALEDARVQLVLVALGSPKQDRVAYELRKRLDCVVIGVGGSFELASGMKSRAPIWMRRTGLEWAYRLAIEPRRLWKRYLLRYPRGVAWLLRDVWRTRHLKSP
jgi:N-acetylglucosaminyldiphosphoundecaprenol N-acetyl-beta-D-mannosaminyltransferase